jgi:uncharacterized protein YndB with AHSA1/START domain
MASTQNFNDIRATPEVLYLAFTDPAALEVWQAPGAMTAKIHQFDLRPGGGYEMSLYYPDSDMENQGKTSAKEDRFSARFMELIPNQKIVQAILFDSPDPSFKTEMIMEITLTPISIGTRVSILFKNIPESIRPEDNAAGTKSSLEKLAQYVERNR